jgi:hypothetical protein
MINSTTGGHTALTIKRAMNDRRTVKCPLAWPSRSPDTCCVTTTSLLHSILDWLRAGYPQGVPGPDRVPQNVQRVTAKRAAAGWPLAGVDDSAV